MIKVFFHILNSIIVILYLYPGSIIGFLIFRDFSKQPQITSDFSFLSLNLSSNHVYSFLLLSYLGLLAYKKTKNKIMIGYLLLISVLLECAHLFIKSRSFEFSDLFGNVLGVLFGLALFTLSKKLYKND